MYTVCFTSMCLSQERVFHLLHARNQIHTAVLVLAVANPQDVAFVLTCVYLCLLITVNV